MWVNLAIQENKKIIDEVTQGTNALRNEVNSHWRQLEEEGKEELREDYQLAYDAYVKTDNLITTAVKTIHVHVKK